MQRALELPDRKPSRWRRLTSWLDTERGLGYALVAPAVIILVGLVGYPFVIAIYLALSDRVLAKADSGAFVGLQNFVNLLQDQVFLQTVVNTFNYGIVSVFFKLVLGMLMALVLNEIGFMKNLFRGLLLLPWIVPTSLSALGWLWMFDAQYSIFNTLLLNSGLIQQKIIWLGSPFWAMLSVQIVNIWRGIPFFGISLLAGMQTIPQEYYEAAELDGANAWGRFRHITWPLLLPVTLVVTLFSIVQTFADFQVVYVLTRGGPTNSTHLFATLAHQTAILGGRLGEGAAVSLFMFPILALAVILQLRYLQSSEN